MPIGIDAVSSLLEDVFGSGVAQLRPCGEGMWSTSFVFVADGAHLVIRFSPTSANFEKDQLACRWSSDDVPIPDVVALGTALDGSYAVSTFAPGEPMQLLDERRWAPAAPAVLRGLVALSAADLSDTSGWGRWDGDARAPADSWRSFVLSVGVDPLGDGSTAWRANLEAHDADATRSFDEAYALLATLDLDDVPRGLVHADLLNNNVHVYGDTLGGVFDWGQSMFGYPAYDSAFLAFMAPAYPSLSLDAVASEAFDALGATLDRVLACHLHIGLLHYAINTAQQNWAMLSAVEQRLHDVTNQWSTG